MKRKLLSLLLLVVVGGASSAWADEHNFTLRPTQEKGFRLKYESETWKWNGDNNLKDYSTHIDYHGNWVAGFAAMQEFEFPSEIDWNKVNSITIVCYTNHRHADFWASDKAFPSEFTPANVGPIAEEAFGIKPANTTDTPNASITSTNTGGGYNSWQAAYQTFTISGDKLTTLKSMLRGENGDTRYLTLLMSRDNLQNNTDCAMSSMNASNENLDGVGDVRPVMYVDYYPVYDATTNTGYDNLNAAFNALTASDTELQVYADQILTGRLTWNKANTLTITPMKDITITANNTNYMWFLANVNSAVLKVGSSEYTITLDGENKEIGQDITKYENVSTISLENVVFQNFNLNNVGHLVGSKANDGFMILDKVTFKNCINPGTAYINKVRVTNDRLVLKGYLNVDDDCIGTTIYAAGETKSSGTTGRIKIDDNSFTLSNPITINWANSSKAVGQIVVIGSNATNATMIDLVDTDYALKKHASKGDMEIVEAYTLPITAAGASTLVLPFEATIPAGLTCYNLNYTSGNNISAEAVVSPLGAGKAVLVKGDEGSYKFVKTTTDATGAVSGQTAANGVLVGNYDVDFYAPANSYVLQNQTTNGLGFYKVASADTKKVAAYRAYMDVTYAAGIRDFFSLDFDDNETTGIKAIDNGQLTMDNVFDLQGRRVSQPQKGLYIVNGKKVFIK